MRSVCNILSAVSRPLHSHFSVSISSLVVQVMNDHLEGKEWLAAGQFTIADIATFSWVFTAPYAGVLSHPLPAVP